MRIVMKPPPPMLPAVGYVTASAKPVATAASTALPPSLRISTPASLASRDMLTTMPCWANVPGMAGLNRQSGGNAEWMTAAGLAATAGAGGDDVPERWQAKPAVAMHAAARERRWELRMRACCHVALQLSRSVSSAPSARLPPVMDFRSRLARTALMSVYS